ncbi:hypothetical protein ACFL35_02350 [Candidatus Riflebacteria bacterium]
MLINKLKQVAQNRNRKGFALVIVLSLLAISAVLMLNYQDTAISQQDQAVLAIHLHFAKKGLIQLARLKTQQPLLQELNRATNFYIGIDPDYKLYIPFDERFNRGPVFAFRDTDGVGDKRDFKGAAKIVAKDNGYKEPLNLFLRDLTLDVNLSAMPLAIKAFQLSKVKVQGRVTNVTSVCKSRDLTLGNITYFTHIKGWVQLTGVGKGKNKKSLMDSFEFEEKIDQFFDDEKG